MILPVILAGGAGTRLWPLSRSGYPKQFLSLNKEATMFQQTIQRLEGIEHQPCMLICNENHRFLAAEQLLQLNVEHSGILLEPFGRNTAPAIALAALQALSIKKGSDPILLVLAADHVIEDEAAFHEVVLKAKGHAEDGNLVTFGIVPTEVKTGYGYIKRGDSVKDGFVIDRFVEKPDYETAEKYVNSGDYYWNSGMFMFKAARYLEVLKEFRPDIYEACEKSFENQNSDLDFIRIDENEFKKCPEDSIDYAVMEPAGKSDNINAIVVPLAANWNDIGDFSALWQIMDHDAEDNVFIGDVRSINTKNTLVKTENRLVATIGVEDLVIIDTKDALLVAHKSQAQDVKSIVNMLKKDQRPEVLLHREVYRPWGKYDSIDMGERFQVKRITVNPGAKLSIQMHHHRAEHWVVVSGTAKVTNGDEVILLAENQSTYIPLGTVHALENPGKIPLELIEVQTGSYLGEDDIVRFEDRYGRK